MNVHCVITYIERSVHVCLHVCMCEQVCLPSLKAKSDLNANATGKREVKLIPGQVLSGKNLGCGGQGGRDCR